MPYPIGANRSRSPPAPFIVSEPSGNSGELDVRALCEQAAGGDLDAAERLLWLHHARLLGLARRKIGVDWQGKLDPEDLLQDAYIDVLRSIADFEAHDEDAFYRWAARIVDHKFIDQVRRFRRKKRDVTREQMTGRAAAEGRETLLSHVLSDTTTPSQIMRREDANAALMSCIAKLPEEYRTVVTRHYLRQEPFATIAPDLDRSEDAVRRLCSRAVEKLRECLGRASHYLSRLP